MSSVIIRKAVAEDRDFIIKSIIEADKSNSGTSSYLGLFDMTEPELYNLFGKIFDEELEACEFGHSGFAVVVDNGEVAASLTSWIEGSTGMPSWQIKSTALFCTLPKANFESLQQKLEKFSSINISRTIGALQIETAFVENNHRGKGYFVKLLNYHIDTAKESGLEFDRIEMITYNSNKIAENIYAKEGFIKVDSTVSEYLDILHYYPGTGMNLWIKNI